ncbi:MAG: ATP-binding cassette domain-containing protein [Microcystis aeruginosa W13-11]|jgi:putative ABC transport system ATP-binding protein|nr:ATP-binding cassette domain-containing protein [Microcystis aeruginosa W13-11]
MTSKKSLLLVNNIGRKLSERWLWRGVSFELFENDCVGLVAPSGTGKTLLMRNLVLLDPIQDGEILFNDKSPTDLSLPIYRSKVMYLPQRATAFEGTVRDNLRQVFEMNVHRQHRFNRDAIENWLFQLGRSPDFLNLEASRLSGGETQLLAFLRILQLEPQVMLLDEPTSSLDPDTTARFEFILKNWINQSGHAYLLTSHDKYQIERMTNRQLTLSEFV